MKEEERKKCYQGDRGFVHVFRHGSRTCNCGHIQGEEGRIICIDGRENVRRRWQRRKQNVA